MDVKNLNWLTYDITGKMKVLKQMNKTSTNSADLPRLFNDLPSKGGPDPFQLIPSWLWEVKARASSCSWTATHSFQY